MLRALIGVVVALLCGAAFVLAADKAEAKKVAGKLKSVDADKGTVTITVGGKDREFTITDATKILVNDLRSYEPKDRLKDPVFKRKGLRTVVTTEQEDGKDVVKEVAVYTGRKG